jgi:phage replication-related protein YjqB (UPF0714/DUF867 family)
MDSELNATDIKIKRSSRESRDNDESWSLDALSAAMCAERNLQPLRSFAQLAQIYQEGVDYTIESRVGRENILCAAWHGGAIERGADLLADAIAADSLSFYAFQALRETAPPHPLRITSIRFDEPRLLSMARLSDFVVGIHCCDTAPGVHRIFVGGGARSDIRSDLIETLRSSNFNAGPDQLFPGHHPSNPCNIGRAPGLQLEITQTYMDWLVNNPEYFQELADTVSTFVRGAAERLWDKRTSRQKR